MQRSIICSKIFQEFVMHHRTALFSDEIRLFSKEIEVGINTI
jgi:hypothetical protein